MFVDIQLERFPSSLTEADDGDGDGDGDGDDDDVLKFNSSVNKIIANTVHTHTQTEQTHTQSKTHSRHTH